MRQRDKVRKIELLDIEKQSYYCFDLKNLKQNIADITHDVNSFINPINLMYRNIDGKVTNKKILQIRRNSAITLFCFSIGMIIVFAITYSISTNFNNSNFKSSYNVNVYRYYLFFYTCTAIGMLGVLIGFVEMCSSKIRKFIAHHAYDTEDDIEDNLENLDRYQTGIL